MIAEDHIFTWFWKEIEKHPVIANFAVYNIEPLHRRKVQKRIC